jgi:hypothetical protein
MARTHRSLYRFELWNRDTGMVADISEMTTSRSFSLGLNRPEQLDLSFDLRVIEEQSHRIGLTPSELLGAGINDIHVWRGNRPIFGTRVRYIKPSLSASGERLELKATGYLDDFKHREVWPVLGVNGGETIYSDTDIGQIILDLIDTTQSRPFGDVGVTPGVIQPSRPMTVKIKPFAKSVKDEIIALTTQDNSVDISFSFDRKLNVHYPQGRVQDDLLFSYPGNITSLSAPEDAEQIVNVSINRGGGNGLDITPHETIDEDNSDLSAASLAIYGRMERIDDYSDVSYAPTLESFGLETVRIFHQPLIIPDVALKSRDEPPLGAYWIGDWVPFAIPNRPSFAHMDNQRFRIHEINATLNDLDTEDIRLTVANV